MNNSSETTQTVRWKSKLNIKHEFQRRRFGFTTENDEESWVYQFGEGAWTRSRLLYVIWRAILAAVMMVAFGVALARTIMMGEGPWYPIYLTNWSLFMLNCYLNGAFVLALWIYAFNPDPSDPEPAGAKWVWFFRSIAQPAALVVSVAYWAAIYTGVFYDMDIGTHAVNIIVVLLDILTSRYNMRLLHVVYCFTYGLIYAIWSVIHYEAHVRNGAGQNYIYKPLNWSHVGLALGTTLIMLFIMTPLAVLIIYGLCNLRNRCIPPRPQRAAAPVGPGKPVQAEVGTTTSAINPAQQQGASGLPRIYVTPGNVPSSGIANSSDSAGGAGGMSRFKLYPSLTGNLSTTTTPAERLGGEAQLQSV